MLKSPLTSVLKHLTGFAGQLLQGNTANKNSITYNFKSSLTSLWTRKNAKPKEKYGRLIIVIDELFVKHTLRYFTVFTNWYVFKYVYFFKQ